MFCKMIAKDFKKLEGKWTYKVFMVGGAVFYEAPCSVLESTKPGIFFQGVLFHASVQAISLRFSPMGNKIVSI